jgi:hypothetical protein
MKMALQGPRSAKPDRAATGGTQRISRAERRAVQCIGSDEKRTRALEVETGVYIVRDCSGGIHRVFDNKLDNVTTYGRQKSP